jgi:hypothetical protein
MRLSTTAVEAGDASYMSSISINRSTVKVMIGKRPRDIVGTTAAVEKLGSSVVSDMNGVVDHSTAPTQNVRTIKRHHTTIHSITFKKYHVEPNLFPQNSRHTRPKCSHLHSTTVLAPRSLIQLFIRGLLTSVTTPPP